MQGAASSMQAGKAEGTYEEEHRSGIENRELRTENRELRCEKCEMPKEGPLSLLLRSEPLYKVVVQNGPSHVLVVIAHIFLDLHHKRVDNQPRLEYRNQNGISKIRNGIFARSTSASRVVVQLK